MGSVLPSLITELCKMKNLLKMKNLYCLRVGMISLLRGWMGSGSEESFASCPFPSQEL